MDYLMVQDRDGWVHSAVPLFVHCHPLLLLLLSLFVVVFDMTVHVCGCVVCSPTCTCTVATWLLLIGWVSGYSWTLNFERGAGALGLSVGSVSAEELWVLGHSRGILVLAYKGGEGHRRLLCNYEMDKSGGASVLPHATWGVLSCPPWWWLLHACLSPCNSTAWLTHLCWTLSFAKLP